MLKLAFLLIGAHAFRARRYSVMVAGVLLMLLAVAMAAGVSDGLTHAATFALGLVLSGGGAIALPMAAATAGVGARRFALARAGAALGAGGLLMAFPWVGGWTLALPLALILLADGTNRLAAALVFRVPGWVYLVFFGAAEMATGAMLATEWPLPAARNLPLCIALFIGLSGWLLLRLGMMLGDLEDEAAILNLPIFSSRGWYEHAPVLVGDDPAPVARHERPLTVRVWTPVASATGPADRRVVIDRYVAAMDRNGVVSTGHSALELLPDLYISHYPAVEMDRSSVDFMTALRSGVENNVPGCFQPDYATESAQWCPADARVDIWNYDRRRLLAFWTGYRQENTYNLTNRNCSVVVAAALDAALEGRLATHQPWWRLLRLLMDPDLWAAALIRSRTNAMSWTPGFVLDYAAALARIVDRPSRSWSEGLDSLLRWFKAERGAESRL